MKPWKQFLDASANHHDSQTEAYTGMMADCEDGSTMHKFCQAQIESHTAQADNCREAMAGFGKGMGMGDALEPLPDGLSRVTPTDIRAVPRTGAPTNAERLVVDREFEKLVAVDED